MFLNRVKVLAAALVALSVAGTVARTDEKDTPTDEKKILGTWTIVTFQEGGQTAAKEMIKDVKVTFAANGKMTVKQGTKKQEFTYKLDSTRKPREYEGTNAKGLKVLGIYRLVGDTLTICFARRGPRPTDFVSKKDTLDVIYVLRREKK